MLETMRDASGRRAEPVGEGSSSGGADGTIPPRPNRIYFFCQFSLAFSHASGSSSAFQDLLKINHYCLRELLGQLF